MADKRTTVVLENIDRRLARVEQILPGLATRDEMHAAIDTATREAAAPLATRDEMHAAIDTAIRAAVAPLATRDEMHAAIDTATRAAVAPLATRDEMHAAIDTAIRAAVAPLATRDEMRAAIREEGERDRRYMQVLTEGLRDDIRLMAEGHLALDRRDAAQHAESTTRIDALELRISALAAGARRRVTPPLT